MDFSAFSLRRAVPVSDNYYQYEGNVGEDRKLVWRRKNHCGDSFYRQTIAVYYPLSRPSPQQERPFIDLKLQKPINQKWAKSAIDCQAPWPAAPPAASQALPAKDVMSNELHDCQPHTPAPCLVCVACGSDSSDGDSVASPTADACPTPTLKPALPAPVECIDTLSDDQSLPPSPTVACPTPPKPAAAPPAPVAEPQLPADDSAAELPLLAAVVTSRPSSPASPGLPASCAASGPHHQAADDTPCRGASPGAATSAAPLVKLMDDAWFFGAPRAAGRAERQAAGAHKAGSKRSFWGWCSRMFS